MQDVPLTVTRILVHGARIHGESQITTWTGEGEPHRRSFREAGARANQLAHALRDDLGVTGDERVATLMWNNAEHVEAYYAIPSMGAVLHTLNLRLPAEQLVFIVQHAADRVVIVNGSLLPLLAPLLPHLSTLEHVVVSGPGDRSLLDGASVRVHEYEELLAGKPTEYAWPELDERQAAAMCYTSGTTGDPKGVVYSHRSIYLHSMQVNMAQSMGLTDQDTTLVVVPQFHVNAWGLPHATFMSGVNMLMPDRFLQPAPLAEMIESERPTHAAAVPTIWQGLLAELTAKPRDVSSLTQVTIGGSACPPSLMAAFDELGMSVCHAWGMTETSPLGTVARPPAHAVGTEEEFAYRLTQGRFPAGVEARLTGPGGERLPWDGESAGELEVRGPWIAGAYYGGAGAEPLRPADKFSPDGWLKTGDVGTISPDGFLTLTDRAKDVIKSGGEWISSVDLENALMSHPDVAEAAVVAVPDEKWGERPLATVVLREGSTADFASLRAFLAEEGKIAKWQLPERWTIVEAVPKTSVGKFDKKVLRRQYAEGGLDVTRL
ncbi:long-chain fatty acid--CoA ligase [Streptomyces sp. NPDC060011]|uniref:long-chain fatty acid--CoA ligase n=1 Tax=unclassified Streptomyces TaxID=2593676 RepID=UPI0013BA8329|nr:MULTISPECIES: long-chain fatty acid--CoA ligase [unclassified Streptomyces]MCX5132181.1 long-chain fatty acid--CoA ligase [Streptomyces sp. NBC_00340]MCX5284334.1 long-chain fatty acid--CoA ligase [Streptomyces sp. NBC_00198]NEB31748.1 long-chain fatty acid--CoA ligase [Streptomyces sp. SID14446]WSD81907.1 long-chain fatty acid--CoA ligase [Streptomyces sp. NBC_01558]WSK66141.1 long-chain fatty acid--CoA ligase [Streptomyces sp. NBC_01281]